MKYYFPTKNPLATLDYTLDLSSWLNANESIASFTVSTNTVIPSVSNTLVVTIQSNNNTQCIVWLSGGDESQLYELTFSVLTNQTRTGVFIVQLPVDSK